MDDTPRDPVRREGPGTPRWVLALGAGILVVVLVVAVAMLTAGGQHGPGQHTGSTGDRAPTSGASGPVAAWAIDGPVS